MVTKRVLVTGGAGFLGSHLCERLVASGHDVVCLDNFSTGRMDNVAPLMVRGNFRVVQHDVIQPITIEADEIYNLACTASPEHYQKNPLQTAKTCLFGAINMLDTAHRCGARILQASTSEVYGDPGVHPQPETYPGHVNPVGPRACYDEGKRCAETLFSDYHRQHGVDIKIMRIFNTYGPRINPDDGRVVSNFVVRALAGAPLEIYGDGTQTRSFCYVDDMIDGMLAFMDSPQNLVGPVNFGNPSEISILELANTISDLTASDSRITYVPGKIDDPRQRCPDVSLARAELGWRPKTDLKSGLGRVIDYFRNHSLVADG